MGDKIKVKGEVEIKVRRKDGSVRLTIKIKNIVTTVGLTDMAKLLAGVGTTIPTHIAIGDGGADVTEGQTDLQGTESSRRPATWTQSGVTATLTASDIGLGLVATVTVREGGLFNAGVGGDMFARFLTTVFELAPTELVSIAWKITFSG